MSNRLGLAVSDLVKVTVDLTAAAPASRNFGATLIFGDSEVIDTAEFMRDYSQLEEVGLDFSSDTPEYKAATLFFAQRPQNNLLYIGRWARTASHGVLRGAILTPSQQAMANFTGITAGALRLNIDGVQHDLTGLNFSAAGNLNGVAAIIQTALNTAVAGTTCVWNANEERFIIKSPTTGTASAVGYSTAPPSGTDIGPLLALNAAAAGPTPVPGIAAQSFLQGVISAMDRSSDWYAMVVAASTMPSVSDIVAAAGAIEGAGTSRFFAITTQDQNVLDSTVSNDIMSQLKALAYGRSFVQYSSKSPYAAVSAWARQSTVNYDANNTVITLMYKDEPGVIAENLSESQASTLKAKNGNVFVNYQNGKAIIQWGRMANGDYVDERVGGDWIQNRITNDVWTLLASNPTKVPQTDAGMNMIGNVINQSLDAAVNNGFCAPGVWNGPPIGQLVTGDFLKFGYYTFVPPLNTQSQSDRAERKSVPIQVALKAAGAVHTADVLVTVNR
jgi:hypothetical protein